MTPSRLPYADSPHAFLFGLILLHPLLWTVIALDELVFPLFPIRQVLCICYIFFVPGIVLLKFFKIREIGRIQTLLFSIGLSISALMLISVINYSFSPFHEFWLPNTFIAFGILNLFVVALLGILIRREDRDQHYDRNILPYRFIPEKAILLFAFPFAAIIGTYLMNDYDSNILLLILLFSITAVFLLFVGKDTIPKEVYPFAVFSMALALVLHQSLISTYIWGWDIHQEFYFANLVLQNSMWDPTIQHNVNAMLSIVSLTPFISDLANIELIWVLKAIYPLLFSFVPVGLYHAYKSQTNEKIAFMASFFFMSFSAFYIEMMQLARQQIAELFFVLIILLLVSEAIQFRKRMLLLTIFSCSLIVSHYGLSYVYLLLLLPAWIILIIIDNTPVVQFLSDKTARIQSYFALNIQEGENGQKNRIIVVNYVFVYSIFLLVWYFFVSQSSCLESALEIITLISSTFLTGLLNPESAEGMNIILSGSATVLHSLSKYVHLLFQGFITVGLLGAIISFKRYHIRREFLIFSLFSFFLGIMSITVPYFAYQLNATRLYHISLFFLSPFGVIGGLLLLKFVRDRIPQLSFFKEKTAYCTISGLLALYFLFNSGLLYEITYDNSNSIALNTQLDYPAFNEKEVKCATWISRYIPQHAVYADDYRRLLLHGYLGMDSLYLHMTEKGPPVDSFVFIGEYNLKENQMLITSTARITANKGYYRLDKVIGNQSGDKIYDNGDAEIRHIVS